MISEKIDSSLSVRFRNRVEDISQSDKMVSYYPQQSLREFTLSECKGSLRDRATDTRCTCCSEDAAL